MEKDILSAIVDVEKEIRKLQSEERAKAEKRLEEVKREIGEEIAGEEKRLQEAMRDAVARAGSEAEKKAAALLEEAEARAERLGRLDDESLMVIIEKHIATLLPGRDHDRQNGEG